MENINKEELSSELRRTVDDLTKRIRHSEDVARKYSILNDRARGSLGCSLEDLV
mgnify:CR=1 FL=1